MNFKIFYRYVFVFLLSVFVFTGCGSEVGSNSFVNNDISEIEVKDNVHVVTENNITEIISKSTTNGTGNIIVSDKLGATLKDGNIIHIPAGIDKRFPLGLSGRIESIKGQQNGNKELVLSEVYLLDIVKKSKHINKKIKLDAKNFVGVIAPSTIHASKQSTKTQSKLNKTNQKVTKSFLNGGVQFISNTNKNNSILEKSFLGDKGEVTAGKIALNLELNLTSFEDENENSGESLKGGSKVIISGSLSDLVLHESHELDLINSDFDPYFKLDLGLEGKFNAELKYEANSRMKLGYFKEAWKDVEKVAFDDYGIKGSVTGLDMEDKYGKYPIVGLIFQSPTPLTVINTESALNRAKVGGFIVWVYFDAKVGITLKGSTGIATHTAFKMGVVKPKNGSEKITKEIKKVEGHRILEAPFIEGELSLTGTTGLSLDIDAFAGGVRFANTGLDVLYKATIGFKTDGRVSYGFDKFGEKWSRKGRMCFEGEYGAGMLFRANTKLGVDAESLVKDVNFNLEYSTQFPDQGKIDSAKDGWVDYLWYKESLGKACFGNKTPIAKKQSVVINTLNSKKKNIIIEATDEDDKHLKYIIKANPKHGKLSGTAPKLTYTPNSGYGGEDSFTFVADDGMESSKEVTVSIWIITEKTDKDKDGIPDFWELKYPNKLDMDKDDSKDDYDGDGVSNYQEYLDKTDPTKPSDFLKFTLEKPIVIGRAVSLKWNDRGSATHFIVYVSKEPIGNKKFSESDKIGMIVPLDRTKTTSSTYGLKGRDKQIPFEVGAKYYVVIRAYSGLNMIYQTNEETFELKSVISAPNNLRAIATDKSITLKWDKVEDVSAYKICISESTITDGSKCTENGGKLIGSTSTLKTISDGLKKDTTYYFRVRGVKSGYNALWSKDVKTKLKADSLVKPGTVKGSVIDAVTNKVLSAKITIIKKDGIKVKSVVTNVDGKYSESLSEGDYIFLVEATNYIPEKVNVHVTYKETTIISSLRQVPNSAKGDGVSTGKLIDALTLDSISTATLKARKGVNVKSGKIEATEYSDGNGEFTFNLPAGNYSVEATADGYISIYFELLVLGNKTTDKQNASMTPNIQAGEIRVVMTWGNKPGDLDSHIKTPKIEGSYSGYHVYWDARGRQYSTPYTKLDVDRTDLSYSGANTSKDGPETITIYESKEGIYHYYIKNYSEGTSNGRAKSIQGSLVNSRATVKIYTSKGLFKTFIVPNSGTGNYWDVFTYDGGTGNVTSINTISDIEPN